MCLSSKRRIQTQTAPALPVSEPVNEPVNDPVNEPDSDYYSDDESDYSPLSDEFEEPKPKCKSKS